MQTVHLILNAHIDPIWLWPWQAGLDAALNTCRTACDLLDDNPDMVFTRGEAWLHREIERTDPVLFNRITKHVASGRWHIVGGWWIQPDCNGPSGFAMRRQIALGLRYFDDRFGVRPRVGYNVDSFGHAPALPRLMREAGQDRYIFMRPQEHERDLPSRVFRWRGEADGPEVVAFRIAGAYQTKEITREHILKSLQDLPEGVTDTMCFVGVGDHGGGPTQRQIDWLREHASAFDDCRLVFSTPAAFFDAVEPQREALPLVVGELQHHAVGCYSVYRRVKREIREAEHRLEQAEASVGLDPAPPADIRETLDEAWRSVCFHHFHDTYGGTCTPTAYQAVHYQLGHATWIAEQQVQHAVRRRTSQLPNDPLQRVIIVNSSDEPFTGYVHLEPWTQWERWGEQWSILDEAGNRLPYQLVPAEALMPGMPAVVVPVTIGGNMLETVRIDREGTGPGQSATAVTASGEGDGVVLKEDDITVRLDATPSLKVGTVEVPLPRLVLVSDPSDTWTHEVDRYEEQALEEAAWNVPAVTLAGPLVAEARATGRLGESRLRATWRLWAGEPCVELMLEIHWAERQKAAKLAWEPSQPIVSRRDGVMAGLLDRELDGAERPIQDLSHLTLADGTSIGVACPDVYAADATPQRLRLTLLRSPYMAHHRPYEGPFDHGTVSDQGVHNFRFRFYAGDVQPETLRRASMAWHRPPLIAELTRGMPR